MGIYIKSIKLIKLDLENINNNKLIVENKE